MSAEPTFAHYWRGEHDLFFQAVDETEAARWLEQAERLDGIDPCCVILPTGERRQVKDGELAEPRQLTRPHTPPDPDPDDPRAVARKGHGKR